MRAQLRSVDTKLKDLASALNTLAPAPTQDSETIIEPDSEHYRESDFYEEPTTPLELANRMRAKQTTGEVWLAAFRITAKKVKYRAIYSLNPIIPINLLREVSEQFKKDCPGLFLRISASTSSVIHCTVSNCWKTDDPAEVTTCLEEYGLKGLFTMPNGVEVEG